MGNIEEKNATTGKCKNFESALAYLLPKYPVDISCNKSNKNNQSHISDTSAQVQGFVSKIGIGNIIVHLRY